jgi:hypothetical protein
MAHMPSLERAASTGMASATHAVFLQTAYLLASSQIVCGILSTSSRYLFKLP